MQFRILCLLAIPALLLTVGTSSADYQFQFTDSSGNVSSAFSVNQGQTVDVRVYLQQSNGETSLSTLGLNAGGVMLTYNQTIANVPNAAAITPNGAFDNAIKSVGTGSATLNLTQDLSAPVTAPTTGANANRILLGTFKFTGVSAGSTITLTADPHAAPTGDNVLGDNTVIDSMIINSSAVITVTAVPEPGSLLLTGLFALGLVGGAYRRYRLRTA